MSLKIITFANHKGGVSKTTSKALLYSLHRGLHGTYGQESPAHRP